MILDLFSSLLGVFVGDDGEYKSIFLSACQLYRSGRRVKTSRDSYYYVHKTHTSEQNCTNKWIHEQFFSKDAMLKLISFSLSSICDLKASIEVPN